MPVALPWAPAEEAGMGVQVCSALGTSRQAHGAETQPRLPKPSLNLTEAGFTPSKRPFSHLLCC